jgi:hypothetical protein
MVRQVNKDPVVNQEPKDPQDNLVLSVFQDPMEI